MFFENALVAQLGDSMKAAILKLRQSLSRVNREDAPRSRQFDAACYFNGTKKRPTDKGRTIDHDRDCVQQYEISGHHVEGFLRGQRNSAGNWFCSSLDMLSELWAIHQ